MGEAVPSSLQKGHGSRGYAEAAGDGEWPTWVGGSGLWGCLETRCRRGAERQWGPLTSRGSRLVRR